MSKGLNKTGSWGEGWPLLVFFNPTKSLLFFGRSHTLTRAFAPRPTRSPSCAPRVLLRSTRGVTAPPWQSEWLAASAALGCLSGCRVVGRSGCRGRGRDGRVWTASGRGGAGARRGAARPSATARICERGMGREVAFQGATHVRSGERGWWRSCRSVARRVSTNEHTGKDARPSRPLGWAAPALRSPAA